MYLYCKIPPHRRLHPLPSVGWRGPGLLPWGPPTRCLLLGCWRLVQRAGVGVCAEPEPRAGKSRGDSGPGRPGGRRGKGLNPRRRAGGGGGSSSGLQRAGMTLCIPNLILCERKLPPLPLPLLSPLSPPPPYRILGCGRLGSAPGAAASEAPARPAVSSRLRALTQLDSLSCSARIRSQLSRAGKVAAPRSLFFRAYYYYYYYAISCRFGLEGQGRIHDLFTVFNLGISSEVSRNLNVVHLIGN